MKRRRNFFCLPIMLLSAACLRAQTTGTLRGTVKDPSGAVVPRAEVTVVQQGTNVSRATTSNEQGGFELPALPVGLFELDVTAPGFKRFVQRDTDVTLGHVVVADAELQLGTVNEMVSAVTSAPLVETTNTQLGAVMSERTITGLPLNARDTYQLLQLQPGVESEIDGDRSAQLLI